MGQNWDMFQLPCISKSSSASQECCFCEMQSGFIFRIRHTWNLISTPLFTFLSNPTALPSLLRTTGTCALFGHAFHTPPVSVQKVPPLFWSLQHPGPKQRISLRSHLQTRLFLLRDPATASPSALSGDPWWWCTPGCRCWSRIPCPSSRWCGTGSLQQAEV